jgi:hypothetical protein
MNWVLSPVLIYKLRIKLRYKWRMLDSSQPGAVKPSPGLPLRLTERPDRGRRTCYWALGPRHQCIYKWAREPMFISQSKPYT